MLSHQQNQTSLLCPRRAGRLCLVAVLYSATAAGAPGDSLRVFGGLGYGHDDNLLRVPDGLPGFDNQLGDSWYQADAGLLFDHTYSRQRINGHAKLSKVKFNHFQQLDYDGKDIQARWNWQVGNHWDGVLGTVYNQTLAPYTDFRSDRRNLREQRRSFADGAWRFHPSYRVRAAVDREKFSYELREQRFNDRTEDSWEFGADYLPASGSEIGLVARHVKGKYPNRRPLGQQVINDDYEQDECKARVLWVASGSTTVQALAGWVKRRQPALGNDTSGFYGRVNASHKRNSVLSYQASLWRDFAPIESPLVSYTQNKGVSAGVTWDATAKLKVDANAAYERRKYNARFLPMSNRGALEDAIRTASVRATWSLRQSLQVSAALAHQVRSGSAALGTQKFSSNSIQLNVTAQF